MGTVLSVGGLAVWSIAAPTPTGQLTEAPPPPSDTDTAVIVAETENSTPTPDPVAAPDDAPEPATDSVPMASTDGTDPTETTEDVAAETATEPEPDTPPAEPARRPADVTEVDPDTRTPELTTPSAPQDETPDETAGAPMPSPDTGEAIATLTEPAAPDSPSVSTALGADSTPGTSGAPSLGRPRDEAGLNISTEPAQPPAPEVPDIETALVPDPESTETPEGEAEPAPAAPETDAVATEEESDPADRPQVRRLVPAAPEGVEPESAEEGSGGSLRPSIGRPAASLTDRNPGNSARLPSISDAPETAPDEASVTPSADTDGMPPLQRYAAQVDSDPSLPRMSIVMIDDGTGPLGPDTLDGFPFPVTFALDPGKPGAAERMTAYRDLGYEVAALIDLPEAAQPTDVEQVLGGATAALPEAVALIEAPEGGLQATRAVTEQAASYAADSGHGLVFLPNGLNTAQAIAQRENVPTISILRDFDGDGQDARTKRRFLDGAAFRARQDGAVVMLGRLTPDTLSALVLWSLQDRASSVSMVPVSTLLLEQAN
jgi:polysaccharide deacetylase 2 family uncharacterized protein YibQ